MIKIEPTLFIGLGGTGKQTLMELRRLIMDGYGAGIVPQGILDRYGPGRLPHTAFLCLDSDERLADLDENNFDELLQAAQMRGSEFLSVEINTEQMAGFYAHPERHPAYRSWYDRRLSQTGVPKHGCGQMRPWGRYAFFQHYPRIRTAIRGALDQLVGVGTIRDAREMDIEVSTTRINVFVVFSVAGGTGSGMFLDTAFLLRDMESEIGRDLRIQALALLPGAFSTEPGSQIFANAYAALLELEHYNLKRDGSGDGFPVYWPTAYDGQSPPRRLPGPAFEATWLISERSRGPTGSGGTLVSPPEKAALTAMMAEWLFLRSSPHHSMIGGKINADASNYIAKNMSAIAKLPIFDRRSEHRAIGTLEQSRRYGSFGLSKIFQTRSAAHHIVVHRLIADLVRGWTEPDSTTNVHLDAALRDAAGRVLLRVPDPDRGELEGAEALRQAIDRGAAKTSTLDDVERTHGSAIDADQVVLEALQKRADPEAALSAVLDDLQRRLTSDREGDPSKQGEAARRIRAAADAAGQRVRQAIDEVVGEALATPGRRFDHARELLARLAAQFKQAAADADRVATERERDAEQAWAGYELLRSHLRTEQWRSDAFDPMAWGSKERAAFTPIRIGRQMVSYHGMHLAHDLERQTYQRVKDLAQGAASLIEREELGPDGLRKGPGLLTQLDGLHRDLKALSGRAEQRVSDLRSRSTSTLNHRIEIPDHTFQVTGDGRALKGEALRETEARLLSDRAVMGDGLRSPWGWRNAFAGAGGDRLFSQLEAFARRETEHVPALANDALGAFDAQHPSTGSEAAYLQVLRPLVSHATAWLPITSTGGSDWGKGTGIARTMRLAYRPTDGSAVRRLKNALTGPGADFSDLSVETAELRQGDAVYFTEDIAGFPLSVVPGVREWRDKAYLPYLTDQMTPAEGDLNPSSALHIEPDAARFGSLVLPTPEEVRDRALAIETFVEALVKQVLAPVVDSYDVIGFARRKTVGFSSINDNIGRYDTAILTLLQSRGAATDLTGQIDAVEDQWRASSDGGAEAKARVLALLDYHLQDEKRPMQLPEWDLAVRRVIGVLSERYGSEAVRLAKLRRANLTSWSQESPPASGFRHDRGD